MTIFTEQALLDLARAASSMGKIIEAHADRDDCVRKVVIELSSPLQNIQLKQSVIELWTRDGFIASVKEGYLIIDGFRGEQAISGMDMVGAVSHQLKTYAKGAWRAAANDELTGSDRLSGMATALMDSNWADARQ